jgi:hypothetical protein
LIVGAFAWAKFCNADLYGRVVPPSVATYRTHGLGRSWWPDVGLGRGLRWRHRGAHQCLRCGWLGGITGTLEQT